MNKIPQSLSRADSQPRGNSDYYSNEDTRFTPGRDEVSQPSSMARKQSTASVASMEQVTECKPKIQVNYTVLHNYAFVT